MGISALIEWLASFVKAFAQTESFRKEHFSKLSCEHIRQLNPVTFVQHARLKNRDAQPFSIQLVDILFR